ncbi:hypothetical protein H8B09_06045 [Paenibacillus sp. PR3]|uniref:Uncharacterized protein n=1 Tax=Paenibacillus terricola TaxID=2763503 RepID=A0ABR8MQN7_9BACL|nr:hypothetical protein [Paenibacillus terricola]MBD3918309.1 hypothetical protein [Paenibacillus terricola]
MTERHFAMQWLSGASEQDSKPLTCRMTVDGSLDSMLVASCSGEEML